MAPLHPLDPPQLDPLKFPLHGSRLIEASAGTGKTWTIAALYVRLVLGHGTSPAPEDSGVEPTAFHTALEPARILVMTFTRAATRELSERIQKRLSEAAIYFRQFGEDDRIDPFLKALREDYPEGDRREAAAQRLAIAADAMDDAAVLTIDAWCQRMLNEHAFDTGNPFDETLVADEDALLDEACRDYWRQQCYPLSGSALSRTLDYWKDVDTLKKRTRPLIGQTIAAAQGRSVDLQAELSGLLQAFIADEEQQLTELADGWVERTQRLRDWLDDQTQNNRTAWNGQKLQSRFYTPWLDELSRWAQSPLGTPRLDLNDSARRRLCRAGMLEAYRREPHTLALPEVFDQLPTLQADIDSMTPLSALLRRHAAHHIALRLATLKRQSRTFSFADMTARLERALTGPRGSVLRTHILEQYPVALIDEFQDTSPEQYRLFDALFQCTANDREHALILIGDPKQSIYAFRGADIYSYLRAREATAGRHYALATNYRSSQAVVTAVNAWFERAEARPDPGADQLGTGGAFGLRRTGAQPMPFIAATAAGRTDCFVTAKGPVPAMLIEYDGALRSANDTRQHFGERCAEQVVTWLNDETAGFQAPDAPFMRLQPGDIAILVRDRFDAAAVRSSLQRRAVSSVFQSARDSVFASPEASDLLRWLRAIASPGDAALARAALATATLDLPWTTLEKIAGNEEAFDQQADILRELHKVWQTRGVLALLRRSLHALDLPTRWLNRPDGERRLTNVLHLAELLQTVSIELDGEQALIRWLAQRIDDSESADADDQILRLESDANLVQIITIHKSKGLEYPVVCLPYACLHKPITDRADHLRATDAEGAHSVRLELTDDDRRIADRERLREDLRLFYVALTRARHTVWLGFSSLKIGNSTACKTASSAPGALLSGSTDGSPGTWLNALEDLQGHAAQRLQGLSPAPEAGSSPAIAATHTPCICVRDLSDLTDDAPRITLLCRAEDLKPLAPPTGYVRLFEHDWATVSFTSLVRGIDSSGLTPVDIHRPAEDERLIVVSDNVFRSVDDIEPTVPQDDGKPRPKGEPLGPARADASHGSRTAAWHRLDGGARLGNLIHALLEWLDSEGYGLAQSEGLQSALLAQCRRAGFTDQAQDILAWMKALIETPLPSLGASLPGTDRRLTEMEFWMPAPQRSAQALDRLCRRYLMKGRPRPPLPPRSLKGMMTGFADLVIEHQGRYWVLDYKTNRVYAPTDSADAPPDRMGLYHRAALEEVMAHHRYDVQAALYLLALHRQLGAQLGPSYTPSRHLGGALYWFVRGLDDPGRGEYALPMNQDLLELVTGLDALLGHEDES
ncbi:MAG: hypothetical protein RL322_1236 [Pseudomonadota bacterium]|jgi:exodeoxyribonuclease V beta subunit